jgi:hypothetical protein
MLMTEPIRLARNLLAYLFYLLIRYVLPLPFYLYGFKRSVVGCCTVLAPAKQTKTILEGIEYLRALDSNLYQQLTVEHRYFFWYHPNRILQCRDAFSICDNFLSWGKEGVVITLVQSIYDYTIFYSNWEKKLKRSRIESVSMRRAIQKKLFEWSNKQNLPSELKHYCREMIKGSDLSIDTKHKGDGLASI